jgi:hypothetical protein
MYSVWIDRAAARSMTGLAGGGPARSVPTRINTGLAGDGFMHINAYILPHEKKWKNFQKTLDFIEFSVIL